MASGHVAGASHRSSVSLRILAVLAVLYTLYFAHAFFIPVFFAIELNFLFSPAIRWARRRLRIPAGVSAAVVVLAFVGAIGFGAYELATPARGWLAAAPETLSRAGAKLHKVLKPVEQVSKTAEQMASVSNVAGPSGKTPQVVVAGPTMGSRFFGTTSSLVASLLEVIVLLYFLLSSGDFFLQKIMKVVPRQTEQHTAVEIARATEGAISMYLVTSAILNVIEGSVVTLAMYLLGMPNPFLWGALVAVLEFIPYVGALTIIAVLGMAALTVFDNVAHALMIPGSFIAINLIQGNLVVPMVMGHRMSLNPVAIFVGVALWWEIWGIAGAFLAVPMLAALKILCDHIESLSAIGEFLGERDEDERRLAVRVAVP